MRTVAPTAPTTTPDHRVSPTAIAGTLTRAQAAALLKGKDVRAQLRALSGVEETYGAFPFLFDEMLAALRENIRRLGRCDVTLTKEQWAAVANLRPGGARVEPLSIPPPFSRAKEHLGLTTREVPLADGIKVRLTIVTPGRRGPAGVPGHYGMRVAFFRGGAPLRVTPQAEAGPQEIQRRIELAEARAQALAEIAAKLGELYGLLMGAGMGRAAAWLSVFARRFKIPLKPVAALAVLWFVLGSGVGLTTYLVVKRFVVPSLLELRKDPTRQGGAVPEPGEWKVIGQVWPGHAYPRIEMRKLENGAYRFRYLDDGLIRFWRRWPDSNIEFTWSITRDRKEVQRFERAPAAVDFTPPVDASSGAWAATVSWGDAIDVALTPLRKQDGGLVVIDATTGRPLSPPAETVESSDGSVRWTQRSDGGVDFDGDAPPGVGYRPGRRPRLQAAAGIEDHLVERITVCLGPLDFALHELVVDFGDGASWRSEPGLVFGTEKTYRLPDGREITVKPSVEPGGLDEWDHFVVDVWYRYRAPGTYTVAATLYDTTRVYRSAGRPLRRETGELTVLP